MHLQETVARVFARSLGLRVQIVACLLRGARDAAHRDYDVGRIGRAVVVEHVVLAACHAGDLRHDALDHIGQLVVGGVVRFAHLEVHVAVLYGGAQHRVLGVESARPEALERLGIHERGELLGVGHIDARELM